MCVYIYIYIYIYIGACLALGTLPRGWSGFCLPFWSTSLTIYTHTFTSFLLVKIATTVTTTTTIISSSSSSSFGKSVYGGQFYIWISEAGKISISFLCKIFNLANNSIKVESGKQTEWKERKENEKKKEKEKGGKKSSIQICSLECFKQTKRPDYVFVFTTSVP